MMKYLALLVALVITQNVLALPTVIMGETMQLTKSDFTIIKSQYSVQDGEVNYAETGYELPFQTLIIGENNTLNFSLSGAINSAWFSSNFAIDSTLYCEGILVAEDRAYGVRYQQVSYSASPYISITKVLKRGCSNGKLVLTKVGNLSRAFYTRLQDFNLNLTIDKAF